MKSSVRRGLIIVAFALLGVFALRQLRGPEGLPSVRQKWDEIRQLEEENAALQREIRERVHARVLAFVRARPAREAQRERERVDRTDPVG